MPKTNVGYCVVAVCQIFCLLSLPSVFALCLLLSQPIPWPISNMNEARKKTRISDSKPASVLNRISATQGLVVGHLGKRETVFVEAKLSQPIVVSSELLQSVQSKSTTQVDDTYEARVTENGPASDMTQSSSVGELDDALPITLRIRPDTRPEFNAQDSVEGFLASCIESAEQVQQLAKRLNESEDELQAREAGLEQRIQTWNERVESLETDLELKLSQLQQQSSQVRCQQLNLIQLQTDIVKSHEATREAIETLVVESGSDAKTVATLKALKYQLSGRFDYIARRWEHLAGLLLSQRDAEAARCSIDDSVDWAGEHS